MKHALYRPHPDLLVVLRQARKIQLEDVPRRLRRSFLAVVRLTSNGLVSDGRRDREMAQRVADWLGYHGPITEAQPTYAARTWKVVRDDEAIP